MKRLDLTGVAASERVKLEIVLEELKSMKDNGEVIGVYTEDGKSFLALSHREVDEIAVTMESQSVDVYGFAERNSLSTNEARRTFEEIADLRQLKIILSVDESLLYTSIFLKKELARILGEN